MLNEYCERREGAKQTNENAAARPSPPHQACPDADAFSRCDCEKAILCNQARVEPLRGAAVLRRRGAFHLRAEQGKKHMRTQDEVESVNGFLTASAEKERALAEIIRATRISDSSPDCGSPDCI
jgi:hypothetical protein